MYAVIRSIFLNQKYYWLKYFFKIRLSDLKVQTDILIPLTSYEKRSSIQSKVYYLKYVSCKQLLPENRDTTVYKSANSRILKQWLIMFTSISVVHYNKCLSLLDQYNIRRSTIFFIVHWFDVLPHIYRIFIHQMACSEFPIACAMRNASITEQLLLY
jgi:hypothetical protein